MCRPLNEIFHFEFIFQFENVNVNPLGLKHTQLYIYTLHEQCTHSNVIRFNFIQFNSIQTFKIIFGFFCSTNLTIDRLIEWEWEGGNFNGHYVRNYRKVSFDWYFIDGTCFTHLHSISKKNISFSSKKWTFWLKNNISLIVDGNTFFFHLFSIDISIRSKCVHFK